MCIQKKGEVETKNQLGELFTEFLAHIEPQILMSILPPKVLLDLSFYNFHNAITGCFFTDRGLILKKGNQSFKNFFDSPEIEGKSLRHLFNEIGIGSEDYDAYKQQLASQGWAKIPQVEVQVGKETHYFSLFSAMTNFQGLDQLKGVQGQFVDITQKVLAEKRQESLAGQIRHDMKNRLMVGSANSESMLFELKSLADNERIPEDLSETVGEFTEMLQEIKESSDFLNNLVMMMLDVSKLQSNQLSLKIEEFDVKDMIIGVVKALRPQQDARAIQVEVLGEAVMIQGDRVQLARVVENYHSNGIKYTKDSLHWKIKIEDGELLLTLQDNGEGLEKEHLERIFDPFFQVPGKEKKNSTGLGLDSVKELVLLHHGQTWAESDGQGKGSRFCMKIPITQAESKNGDT